MKIASILPIHDISKTFDGQYAMLLAHLKDHYPKNPNPNCYVIMDNSLIELGQAVDVDFVYEAAEQCGADEFILPDVFQDGDATIDRVREDIEHLRTRNKLDKFRLMAVCHGKTIEEFVRCFITLEQIPEIHCIGIPKVAGNLITDLGSRAFLEPLWRGSPKNIHLLGCTRNLNEFRRFEYPAKIRSFDTCLPALLSQTDKYAWKDRPEKTIDLYNDKIDPSNYEVIMYNLRLEGLV